MNSSGAKPDDRLERQERATGLLLKRAELRLARARLEHETRPAAGGLKALLSPTGVVLVGAALGLLGTAVGKYADYMTKRRELETSIILKASDVPATLDAKAQAVQRARNLLWFTRAHYITLPPDFETQLYHDAELAPGQTLGAPVVNVTGTQQAAAEILAAPAAERGIKLAEVAEGFTSRVTSMRNGTLAIIGFDHELTPAEKASGTIAIGNRRVAYANGISREDARLLLAQDMAPSQRAIDELVKVPLTPQQRGALASFVRNVGTGAFARSSLLTKLNAGNYAAVPAELARFSHSHHADLPGLQARRELEAKVWTSP